MTEQYQNMIVGQGLAGSAIAWTLYWAGETLVIIDRGEEDSASRISAGLITPMTGKRFVRSPDYDEAWAAAVSFYRRVEQETGKQIFKEESMLRLFGSEKQRDAFIDESDQSSEIKRWEGTIQRSGETSVGLEMGPAGRLDVTQYLSATKEFFRNNSTVLDGEVRHSRLSIGNTINLLEEDLQAERLIIATGATEFELFEGVPNNRSRGDILDVQIERYSSEKVVHRSIWIAQESDGTQRVGATYDWTGEADGPTQAAKGEILQKLSRLVDGEVEIIGHKSGLRPTMKDYEPVVGRHASYENVFLMNGLGSKGALRGPKLAAELMTVLNGGSVSERIDYGRLAEKSVQRRPLTARAQELVQETLSVLKEQTESLSAIDATVGNGFDTCFLAETVGETGRVVGFDVQEAAITATGKRLKAKGLNNVDLTLQSHEALGDYATDASVAAIMFNLGYLPRSDHEVTTKASSTKVALESALKLLCAGGILTILSYRGHEGGQEEFETVERLLLRKVDGYDFDRVDSQPPKPSSPVLFVVKKR